MSNKLRLFMSLCHNENLAQTMLENDIQEDELFMSLRQLEANLDTKLFEQVGDSITLTPEALLLEARLSQTYQQLLALEALLLKT